MRRSSADRGRRAKGRARRAGSFCGRCRRHGATDRPAGRSSRRPSREVGFALRIGGKQLDRQRMAVERAEEAGQGGVGGEMIAGVAQEQGARIGVLKLFDVSQRSRAGARKFWRLAANGDDEPEAVDGGEPAQKRLSRGCILVARASPDCRGSPASADRRRRRRSWPPLRKPRPMPEGRDRSQAGSRRRRRSALARD